MNNERLISVIKLIALTLIIVFLQNIISNMFQLNNVWYPDVTLVFILVLAQFKGRRTALLIGFLIGFLQDLSAPVLGMFALSKTIAAFIAGFFPYDSNYNRTRYVYGLLSVVSIAMLTYYSLVFYGHISFFENLIRFIIPNMLYSVFVGSILYFSFEKWITQLNVTRS